MPGSDHGGLAVGEETTDGSRPLGYGRRRLPRRQGVLGERSGWPAASSSGGPLILWSIGGFGLFGIPTKGEPVASRQKPGLSGGRAPARRARLLARARLAPRARGRLAAGSSPSCDNAVRRRAAG